MSKTSHNRHEHKAHQHHAAEVDQTDTIGPSFGQQHKVLIWIIIVVLVLFVPLLLAALSVLRIIH